VKTFVGRSGCRSVALWAGDSWLNAETVAEGFGETLVKSGDLGEPSWRAGMGAAEILRAQLPQTAKRRSGDLGEILAGCANGLAARLRDVDDVLEYVGAVCDAYFRCAAMNASARCSASFVAASSWARWCRSKSKGLSKGSVKP